MNRNPLGILADSWSRRSLREHYWAGAASCKSLRRLVRRKNKGFRQVVFRDLAKFVCNAKIAVEGETLKRARAAALWLAQAQDATSNDGVSYGYFPCERKGGWRASYPETTGYITPSFLDFADLDGDDQYRERAIRMAHWEADIQMKSGAVQGGIVCDPKNQTPAAFNTGMVLYGWSRLLETENDSRILEAATKAAQFLVADMTDDGFFRTNGAFVSDSEVKIYNCLCAWALQLFGDIIGERIYQQGAVRAVEAAIPSQESNGWIRNNSLDRPEVMLTHTFGYALQAFLEVGILTGREDFIGASRRGIDAVIPLIAPNGFLRGSFFSDWRPAVFSSCLTGSAQLAIVMYRLSEQTQDDGYRQAADRLVNFLKGLQAIDSLDPNLNGALAGSYPILGQYMTRGYPNWATKYLLDALMLQLSAARTNRAL